MDIWISRTGKTWDGTGFATHHLAVIGGNCLWHQLGGKHKNQRSSPQQTTITTKKEQKQRTKTRNNTTIPICISVVYLYGVSIRYVSPLLVVKDQSLHNSMAIMALRPRRNTAARAQVVVPEINGATDAAPAKRCQFCLRRKQNLDVSRHILYMRIYHLFYHI